MMEKMEQEKAISETEQIKIGQTVEVKKISPDSNFIFRVSGKDGLYCLFYSKDDKPTILEIFKAEDGQHKGKWLVRPSRGEEVDPTAEVEIVDTYGEDTDEKNDE